MLEKKRKAKKPGARPEAELCGCMSVSNWARFFVVNIFLEKMLLRIYRFMLEKGEKP